MDKILVVDDDRALQKVLKRLFEPEGYIVDVSSDGESALDAFRSITPSAVILDLNLPVLSGERVCREIKRQAPDLPILVLSASADTVNKVLLFELGADDYITKPFSPRELLARVRVAIRRRATPNLRDEMNFGGVCVDFVRMTAIREGRPLQLTTLEFKMLNFFFHHAGEVISREAFLREVFGYADETFSRTVDNHILKLRQKLEQDAANPTHICTVHGEGYKFIP